LLHHSRYAVDDRTWLDRKLLSIFGPNGNRGSIIAVTTQTAEQSLDIDADLLITDACPADVLLQRLGRLHRHRAGTRPTAVLIDPGALDQYLLPKGKVLGRLGQGWPWVYNNLLSVRATLDWLRSGRSISIPDDCRSLVERATHADYLRDIAVSLGGSWTATGRGKPDRLEAALPRSARQRMAAHSIGGRDCHRGRRKPRFAIHWPRSKRASYPRAMVAGDCAP
jgi:CRISPR-associated endonuclease/helicase Cas3